MSGSPIVTDVNDFDFAICDELGQEVQVGLYDAMLVGAVDLAIYWILRHRAGHPGMLPSASVNSVVLRLAADRRGKAGEIPSSPRPGSSTLMPG